MTQSQGILEQIVQHKQQELELRRSRRSLEELRGEVLGLPQNFSLRADLERRGGIIAEIKRRSPSAGELRPGLDIAALARTYAEGGAAAISVLTDERFFGMQPGDLQIVREAVHLPILRKDFILDEYGVFESKAMGADIVLLIVRILDDLALGRLIECAHSCGLEALVEVHNEAEFERALAARAGMIGVNSRDLQTFSTDLTVVERLAQLKQRIAPDITLVAESGIRQRDQLASLQMLGVKGFLIGEALLRAEDPAALLRELRGEAVN